MRHFITALLLAVTLARIAHATELKPIKVLWCTGGTVHDYKGLEPILTKGIQKNSPVPIHFTTSTTPGDWAKKGFADGYDVIVLFFTLHDKAGQPIVDNIAQTIHDGKPAVVIHGTLHSYRELGKDRDAFCAAIGLTSVKHDKIGKIATKKLSDHWIVGDWPADWKTSHDELYENVKFWPTATPLLSAHSKTSDRDQVVAWINQYGKGRVFGTSLGHASPTTDMPSYHKLLANGLLWTSGCDQRPKAPE